MTLRLVLVSIVACLGLSLPSAERLERWTRSSQAWLNGGHPEWETGELLDEERFVVVADSVEVPPLVSPVPRTEAAIDTTIAPTAVATTPDADAASKAWEADWLAAIEREAAPPSLTAEDATLAPIADLLVAPTPDADAASKAWEADWLAAIEREAAPPSLTAEDATLALVSAESDVPATISEAPAAVVSEAERVWWDALLAELALPTWSADTPLDVPAPTNEAAPAAPVTTAMDPRDAAFGEIVEEMVSSFAKDTAAHSAAPVVAQAPAPETVAASAPPAPIFEPMDIDGAEPTDVASVLNRTAEGLPPNNAMASKAPAPEENRLTHAVRLTRDAVNAWANLLHGPALVTIER